MTFNIVLIGVVQSGQTGVFSLDLLFCEYDIRRPLVADINASETHRNGTGHLLNILVSARAIFLAIIVSPRRNFPKFSKSSRNNSRMFSCSQFQFHEGEFQ